jgi:hypothetical protein
MLLFITTSMHLMIYFFYPKVYLSRMQDQLEKKMDTLQQEIKRNTAAEAGQIFSDFIDKYRDAEMVVIGIGEEWNAYLEKQEYQDFLILQNKIMSMLR